MPLDYADYRPCASREEAEALIQKLAPIHWKIPANIPLVTYPFNNVEYEVWSGRRRFRGGEWTSYESVAQSKDEQYIHLSEYWDYMAGEYKKISQAADLS